MNLWSALAILVVLLSAGVAYRLIIAHRARLIPVLIVNGYVMSSSLGVPSTNQNTAMGFMPPRECRHYVRARTFREANERALIDHREHCA